MPGQEPVRLERAFLEELEERSAGRRTEWRKEAEGGGIDKESRVGLLVDDLTGEREGEGRVLTVEIKVSSTSFSFRCSGRRATRR